MHYLRNTWYPAAWASEVSAERPLARKLLDEPVVMFRDSDGKPAALNDRCPHRFAPLSGGKLIGDSIQCPYHGLQFGPHGRCTHNPHGPVIAAAKVRTYPLLELRGLIWIWMGDAAKVDEALLPDYGDGMDTGHREVVTSRFLSPGNYQLIIDNLLDLSHAQFLHPFLGNPDSSDRVRFSARTEGTRVWSLNDMPGEPVSKLFEMLWPGGPKVGDKRINMRWDPPANLLLEVGYAPCGGAISDGPTMLSVHLLTPETETTTHYFWAGARDTVRDNVQLGEHIRSAIEAAFINEDGPIIAACQQRMGTTDLMSLKPILLKIDTAAVSARRVLSQLIDQEQRAVL